MYYKIAEALGLEEKWIREVEIFSDRLMLVSGQAFERDCKLFVDAEQTQIQVGIDLFAK